MGEHKEAEEHNILTASLFSAKISFTTGKWRPRKARKAADEKSIKLSKGCLTPLIVATPRTTLPRKVKDIFFPTLLSAKTRYHHH